MTMNKAVEEGLFVLKTGFPLCERMMDKLTERNLGNINPESLLPKGIQTTWKERGVDFQAFARATDEGSVYNPSIHFDHEGYAGFLRFHYHQGKCEGITGAIVGDPIKLCRWLGVKLDAEERRVLRRDYDSHSNGPLTMKDLRGFFDVEEVGRGRYRIPYLNNHGIGGAVLQGTFEVRSSVKNGIEMRARPDDPNWRKIDYLDTEEVCRVFDSMMSDPDAASFVENVQAMARGLSGSIAIITPDSHSIVEPDGFLTARPEEGRACGTDQGDIKIRLRKIAALIEHQQGYDADETYIAVVTDWPDRGQEAAQWIVNTLGMDAVPMIVQPHVIDSMFDGEPSWGTVFHGDGNNRVAAIRAAVVGLHDRLNA